MSEEVYLVPVDLYRLGNSTSPRLDNVRTQGAKPDIATYEQNSVTMVVADGHGISTFTWEEFQKRNVAGWVWRIPKDTPLPLGLALVNDQSGHYMVVPTRNMPLDEYKGLLSALALSCHRVLKKEARR